GWVLVEQVAAVAARSLVGLGQDVPAKTFGDSTSRMWFKAYQCLVLGELPDFIALAVKGNSLMSNRSALPLRTRLIEALGGETFDAAQAVTSMTHDGASPNKTVTVTLTGHGYSTG